MSCNVIEVDGTFQIVYKKKILGLISITVSLKGADGKILVFSDKRSAQAHINFSKNPRLKK
jgi:predicted transglutaminase-like protease